MKQKISSLKYKNQEINFFKATYSDGSTRFTYIIGETPISTPGLKTLEQAEQSAKGHIDTWEDDIKDGWVKF